MSNLSFSAAVAKWVQETEVLAEAVFHESVEELLNRASMEVRGGGNMPVDTGTLRASLTLSATAMPPIKTAEEGAPTVYSGAEIAAQIEGFALGTTIYAGWTVAYAARIEYGFDGVDSLGRYYSQPGRGFVRKAAQDWSEIVNRSVRRAAAKVAFAQS
ncbi:hypothetical protein GCM10011390_41700 [Aureimonas endophytica]|uniref:HK97 gp10 family phage protein n=1 Tax=Aureimonas endophytica TaxID=2027858 RepID=A0A917EA33_9HYPH|nr:hypothetical protein [Aureimonas endophytica]GGE18182.1 hypothetical protein GCM10011390_41700 [Aureimonas endophytica]